MKRMLQHVIASIQGAWPKVPIEVRAFFVGVLTTTLAEVCSSLAVEIWLNR